jgi:beta-phosphoglucomutase-like phosphatase (HAD superfamily)
VALVTRASREETDIFLRLSGLAASVACVVAADDVLDLPPAPELFDKALAQLGRRRPLRRDRSVALVGAAASIRAARRAGLRALAVGAPAHVAMEADGSAATLAGLTLDAVTALAGVAPVERPA